LSKAWLEIWYTYPNLSFSDSQFIGKSIQPMEDIVGTTRKFLKFCDYLMIRMSKFGDYVTVIFLYIVFWNTKIIGMFPKPMED
jgi:hypothetical protein